MRLYHVAVGKHDLVRTFTPRVPESAESLEGCLSAIGHPFYYPGKPELLTVWEYDGFFTCTGMVGTSASYLDR